MFDELLDGRVEAEFRESFVRYFKENMQAGLTVDQLVAYINGDGFRNLNEKCNGYGPVFLGMVIHRLIAARKIEFKEGKYVNTARGIDNALFEGITSEERKDLANLLLKGLVVGDPGPDI